MQTLRVERTDTAFTHFYTPKSVVNIPIAHGEGNYFADDDTLKMLEDNDQILFRYCDAGGNITPDANPNGSRNNIAGICNEKGNVLGMMPHPERVCDRLLGGTDGKKMFKGLMEGMLVSAISHGLR
jgi:phosphoribosylformylglycinamidine synthase